MEPFVPVSVPNYSEKEFESCYLYYLDRNWLQHPHSKFVYFMCLGCEQWQPAVLCVERTMWSYKMQEVPVYKFSSHNYDLMCIQVIFGLNKMKAMGNVFFSFILFHFLTKQEACLILMLHSEELRMYIWCVIDFFIYAFYMLCKSGVFKLGSGDSQGVQGSVKWWKSVKKKKINK